MVKVALVLALLAGVFLAGWFGHVRYRAGIDAQEALQVSENARESERLAARRMNGVHDALTQDRLRSERAAVDAGIRLRQFAASASSPAGCPGRNEDPRPAAAVLHDDVREDLVALAREADAVADRLRAYQAAGCGAD